MKPHVVSSYFLLAVVLWGLIFFGPKTSVATESSSLVSLVRDYIQGGSAGSSQEIFQAILQRPDVNLQAVEAAIREVPQYSKAPIGAQPQRSVKIRGQDTPFALYVPPSYTPDRAYPLILCLHGAGFTGEVYLERWVPRLEDRYILACPTIAMGAWWTRFGEDLTLAVLERVSEDYHVDPDRVFLTGMSNGGIGTWLIGMHHADMFAGIAPMASGLDDVLFPFIENLTHTPVYVIHGAEDQVMPVQLSRDLVQEMKRRGVPHLYREHDLTHPHAGGHFFPRQELPLLITWFDQQRRRPLPRQISMVRDATHLMPMSWARIDSTEQIAAFTENLIDSRDEFITGMIYAKLHAEIVGPNLIEVKTLRVKRYTIFFDDALVDFSQPIVVKTNGVTSFKGMVQSSIETLLQEARQRADVHILYSAKLAINLPPSQ